MTELDSGETLQEVMTRISTQEATRHTRIDDIIESTELRGIYEILDQFNFSTDDSVATGRPEPS